MVGTTGKGWLAGMVVAGALFGAGAVAGLEESPRDQLERVTSHLLEGIRQSPQEDRESLKAFVEETVEPELDRDRILRIILGKMRYAQTSVEDRAAFYDALKTQMFRLYAESLSANSDGTLRYLPYEEDSSKPYQVVRSEFSRPSGESWRSSTSCARSRSTGASSRSASTASFWSATCAIPWPRRSRGTACVP